MSGAFLFFFFQITSVCVTIVME